MGFSPRRPVSFTPLSTTTPDGTGAIPFGIVEYEFQESQGLWGPDVPVPGSNYTYDQLGISPSPRQVGKLQLRYTILSTDPAGVDDLVDDVVIGCPEMGLGKVWWEDRFGATRWRYGRALQVPSLTGKVNDIFTRTVGLDFRLQSDAFAGSGLITDTQHLTLHSSAFVETISGRRPIYNATIILRGTWAAVVQFINTTSGQSFSYLNDTGAAANDWVKFDCGANRVFRSTDGGANYVGVDSRVRRGPMQQALMTFNKGANSITVVDGAVPDSHIDIIYTPAY